MNSVIAALDDSPAAAPVIATASRVAELYGGAVRALHAREDGAKAAIAAAEGAGVELESVTGPPVERLIDAAEQADVRAVVLGARGRPAGRRPAGSTALTLITVLRKPVVVVPPDTPRPGQIESVLVPLDGSSASAAALAGTIELARGSGLEVIILHVHEEERLPRFSDQLQHEARTWAEEFVARNCPCPLEEVRLELRVGKPHEHLLHVAREAGADLLVMGWSQDLGAGRAAVVREALAHSRVPLLLLPVDERPRARAQ